MKEIEELGPNDICIPLKGCSKKIIFSKNTERTGKLFLEKSPECILHSIKTQNVFKESESFKVKEENKCLGLKGRSKENKINEFVKADQIIHDSLIKEFMVEKSEEESELNKKFDGVYELRSKFHFFNIYFRNNLCSLKYLRESFNKVITDYLE